MRVLFHIEPLIMHNRPFHYWAWLGVGATMGKGLLASGQDWDVRWAMNQALSVRALAPTDHRLGSDPLRGHGLEPRQLIVFGQEEIRERYQTSNVAILDGLQHHRWSEDILQQHAQLFRERAGDFEPDVIITWTPSDVLRRAYPNALILHTENGIFSRPPYPPLQFFDPQGLYGRSLLATHAEELRARAVSEEEQRFLADLRGRLRLHHEATTAFAETERRLRERYRSLALLPLQFGGEAGFDVNGPFRNQGEYLFHVLERIPSDVGVLLTEHATGAWVGDRIDEETQAYLSAACPQLHRITREMCANAGQTLVHHVDHVISVSSSVGLQARFWGRSLVCPGWSHLRSWAQTTRVEDLGPGGVRPIEPEDGAFAWLLRHYFVRPQRWLFDGRWLDGWLRRGIERWQSGCHALDFYEEAEPLDRLSVLMPQAVPDAPARVPVAADLLENGDLAQWNGVGPKRWQWIAGKGAQVSVQPAPPEADEPHGIRIVRSAAGETPTLLLQRIAGIPRLAGAFVTVRFLARGPFGECLSVYFYQQFGSGGSPPVGTEAAVHALEPEWQEFAYTVTVPGVDGARLGRDHHTELVLLMPPGIDASVIEIADVRLEPGSLI